MYVVDVPDSAMLGGRDWILVGDKACGCAFVAAQCGAEAFRELAEALSRLIA